MISSELKQALVLSLWKTTNTWLNSGPRNTRSSSIAADSPARWIHDTSSVHFLKESLLKACYNSKFSSRFRFVSKSELHSNVVRMKCLMTFHSFQVVTFSQPHNRNPFQSACGWAYGCTIHTTPAMAKVMAITFPKEMCEASDSLRGLDATVAEDFDERFDIISVQKSWFLEALCFLFAFEIIFFLSLFQGWAHLQSWVGVGMLPNHISARHLFCKMIN